MEKNIPLDDAVETEDAPASAPQDASVGFVRALPGAMKCVFLEALGIETKPMHDTDGQWPPQLFSADHDLTADDVGKIRTFKFISPDQDEPLYAIAKVVSVDGDQVEIDTSQQATACRDCASKK